MKAVIYDHFGPAAEVLSLQDLPDPTPGPGEVVVDLAFSGVNPSDVKARAGARPGVTKPPFPQIIPHSDGSGVISTVGTGVDPARIGEKVYIWNGQWQRPFGTAAEKIALPAAQAVTLPEGCSLEEGAVLGIPGMTAAWLIAGSGGVQGQTVLVQGGGGTVGYLAVQMARHAGARVLATCSPRDADRVSAAGAEHVFDYRAPDLAAQILSVAADGIDRGIAPEFGANIAVDTEILRPMGRIMAYGSALNMTPELPYGPIMFKAITIETVLVYLLTAQQRAVTQATLQTAFAAGALSLPVASVMPLADSALAHDAVAAGGRAGAILLDCRTA